MHSIEVRNTDGTTRAKMRGEFDFSVLEELRSTLDGLVGLRRAVDVDLSGVTFLDLQVSRELAVYSRLYGHHFVFRDPSWQACRSIRACGLEGWIQTQPESLVFSAVS